MTPKFAGKTTKAIPVHVIESSSFAAFAKKQSKEVHAWIKSSGFTAALGSALSVPNANGSVQMVLAGWGTAAQRVRGRHHFATIAQGLPKGTYEIVSGLKGKELESAAYDFLLAGYRFDRYAKQRKFEAKLKAPKSLDAKRLEIMAKGEFLTRDLINTPASDMGPDALEAAFRALAKDQKAKVKVIKGDALIKQNFPMIHAVGRAAQQQPRLLDMVWGKAKHPKVTLVGKGVCFDTGGLNIKPAGSMGLMKKDMGGSATVLGLAYMIMALGLPIRLRVLVPAVENSISDNAYRPQDILTSRKGLTVEINNTDAEGRLVLADALALADEEKPDLLVCKATLTGAARVALGPDLPPFYTDDDKLAADITRISMQSNDPLWQMPFWNAYETMIEPGIADLDNAPKGGFAGSITAALFLRRFVDQAKQFVHFDLYGWTPSAKPGRPKGGACQSARAMLAVIEKRYG